MVHWEPRFQMSLHQTVSFLSSRPVFLHLPSGKQQTVLTHDGHSILPGFAGEFTEESGTCLGSEYLIKQSKQTRNSLKLWKPCPTERVFSGDNKGFELKLSISNLIKKNHVECKLFLSGLQVGLGEGPLRLLQSLLEWEASKRI